jgi:hypothetical protein
MFGCGGTDVAPTVALPAPTSYYQIVTVSDLHFNPLSDPSLFPQLVSAAPSQWATIFQSSSVAFPTRGGTDTNYALLMFTLASVQQNLSNSPVVVFTGDLLGHNIPVNFCKIYASLNRTTIENCCHRKLHDTAVH